MNKSFPETYDSLEGFCNHYSVWKPFLPPSSAISKLSKDAESLGLLCHWRYDQTNEKNTMSLNQRPTRPRRNKNSSSLSKISDRLHLSQNRLCHVAWSCFPIILLLCCGRSFVCCQRGMQSEQRRQEIFKWIQLLGESVSQGPQTGINSSLSAKELSLPWKVKFVTRKENFTMVCSNNLGSRILSQVLSPHKANVSIISFSEITIYYPCRRP